MDIPTWISVYPFSKFQLCIAAERKYYHGNARKTVLCRYRARY